MKKAAAITTTEAPKAAAKKKAAKKAAPEAATTTEESSMKFTADTITVLGLEKKAAAYGIRDTDNSVFAFVSIDNTPVRIHIGEGNKYYAEAKKAAEEFIKAKEAATTEAPKAAAKKKAAKKAAPEAATTTTEAKGDNTMKKAAAITTTEAPKAAAKKKAAPKATKTLEEYINSGINGNGWRFVFDTMNGKTRLVFDKAPTEKQVKAVAEAGFYYSKVMNSYNKKLTLKAAAAAEALAKQL